MIEEVRRENCQGYPHSDSPRMTTWNHPKKKLKTKIDNFVDCLTQLLTKTAVNWIIWNSVRYFFHQRYLWNCGPRAARK